MNLIECRRRWTSCSFYFIHSIFKGENPTHVILLHNFNIGLYSDIYRPISFKLSMIEATKLYIVISVRMTIIFIQSHSFMRNQKLGVHLLANLHVDLDEIQHVATTCWFVEAHCTFYFVQLTFRGEKSADRVRWNMCLAWSWVRALVNHFVSNLMWC